MSLSSRVERVLSRNSPDSVEAFEAKSLEEMGNSRVSFGRAHVGKSFLEMWENEKAWVKWFIRTYADSQKEEHRKMVIYVEKMVQQHETDQGLPPLDLPEPHQGIVQPRCKGYPKAKAAPASASNMPADVMTVMSEDLFDPWDVMEPMTREVHRDPLPEEVQALQTRVLSIENALTEILSLMRPTQ